MGLDIYVGDEQVWGSRYSTFNDWRDHINQIGGGGDYESMVVRKRNGYGYWDEIPEEPLAILMIHHDDVGYIYPREAEALKARIRGLMNKIDPGWRVRTKQFLRGLSLCIKTGERIEFT